MVQAWRMIAHGATRATGKFTNVRLGVVASGGLFRHGMDASQVSEKYIEIITVIIEQALNA